MFYYFDYNYNQHQERNTLYNMLLIKHDIIVNRSEISFPDLDSSNIAKAKVFSKPSHIRRCNNIVHTNCTYNVMVS